MLTDASSLPDAPDRLDARAERVAVFAFPVIHRYRCLLARRVGVMSRGAAELRPSDRSDTTAGCRGVAGRPRVPRDSVRERPRRSRAESRLRAARDLVSR